MCLENAGVLWKDLLRSLFLTPFAAVFVMVASSAEIDKQREMLAGVLLHEMQTQQAFVKVHAAEALIAHGRRDAVREAFQKELDGAQIPYAIGVWRVLARVAESPAERESFVERLRAVARDPASNYRIHSIESLAKLGEYRDADRAEWEAFIAKSDDAAAAFAQWLLALSGKPEDQGRVPPLLKSADPIARLRALYALSRTEKVSPAVAEQIAAAATVEPLDSPARVYALSAAIRHGNAEHGPAWSAEARKFLTDGKPNEALEAGFALSVKGDHAELPVLLTNLKSQESDARIGSADGALRLLGALP